MMPSTRFWRFVLTFVAAGLLIGGGAWLEMRLFQVAAQAPLAGIAPIGVFFGVVNLNVLLLALCVFLVMRAAVKLAVDRKKGAFGSSLQTKLVTSFVAFAVLPTVVLLYTTGKFVDTNIEKWLPASLVETSRMSAASEREYLDLALQALQSLDLAALRDERKSGFVDFVYDLEGARFWPREAALPEDPKVLVRRLELAFPRLQDKGEAKWFAGASERERPLALRRVASGTVAGFLGPKPIQPGWQLVERDFASVDTGVGLLRLSFYSMLAVLSLLIVFAASWLGFTIARELSGPLLALSRAAERVAQGDYAVEIDEFVSDDEMGFLAQSFRSMVLDLRAGHEGALAASQEIAAKARALARNSAYNALLVEHVRSGIIAMTAQGIILTWNRMVENLFGVPQAVAVGRLLHEVMDPEVYASVFGPGLSGQKADGRPGGASGSGQGTSSDPLVVTAGSQSFRGVIDGRERHLQINIILGQAFGGHRDDPLALKPGPESSGSDILILIEDLTELERAQRIAAWRDVARRVAHEIKNPLTPITLGIQRIQRRFLPRLEGKDLEVFQDSVRIVIDSTESIRKLVDEFNRFARMPQALLRPGNLVEVVELALNGFRSGDSQGVALRVLGSHQDSPDPALVIVPDSWAEFGKSHPVAFDKDQIVRLVTNLVTNAVEACDGAVDLVTVDLIYATHEGCCYLVCRDLGPGIPKNLRSRIFEPYFSTRRKGSGLGLPIVRQIVTEHGGDISVFDNHPRGAMFKVSLPLITGHVSSGQQAGSPLRSGPRAFGPWDEPGLDD